MKSIYELQSKNRAKTFFLISGFIGFVGALFYALSVYLQEPLIAVVGLVSSTFQVSVAYFNGDKIALKMNGSVLADKKKYIKLHRMVENLAIASGIPKPAVYVSPDPSANAFATGRNPEHASICVNEGLLNLLNKQELEGVLAHELSHIKNRDILVMTITAILASSVAFLADMASRIIWGSKLSEPKKNSNPLLVIAFIVIIVLAPMITLMIQMAVSRSREYLADASAIALTRYPKGMISALEKLYKSPTPTSHFHTSTNHFFIAPPKKSFGEKFKSLFSTHPSLESRVEAIKKHS